MIMALVGYERPYVGDTLEDPTIYRGKRVYVPETIEKIAEGDVAHDQAEVRGSTLDLASLSRPRCSSASSLGIPYTETHFGCPNYVKLLGILSSTTIKLHS